MGIEEFFSSSTPAALSSTGLASQGLCKAEAGSFSSAGKYLWMNLPSASNFLRWLTGLKMRK
jgi:hypothetical protein